MREKYFGDFSEFGRYRTNLIIERKKVNLCSEKEYFK